MDEVQAGDLWEDPDGGRWFARAPWAFSRDIRLWPPLEFQHPSNTPVRPPEDLVGLGWRLVARMGQS